ncbi:hypothetical protein TIFTF001_018678 [Ficus carica]|uniref:Uncharacterized protein n=1 Tax=Ficus carica TaxID=3494 RepID=A0AA88AEF6_FICCA|nr:hypothetical protein TIFTF001_018678 [Ficus carica]
MEAQSQDDSSPTVPPVPDHKLCGFLCAVLTVTSPSHPTPPLGTPFHIFRHDSSVGFRSHGGSDAVFLSPVNSPPRCEDSASGCCSEENGKPEKTKKKKKKKKSGDVGGLRTSATRRRRSVGMVNGSMSVVEHLHALVTNKCLRISTRLVWAEAGVGGEVRAVLLVDVYLPIELWSGWQFPKCGSVAGSLFRHLRCEIS